MRERWIFTTLSDKNTIIHTPQVPPQTEARRHFSHFTFNWNCHYPQTLQTSHLVFFGSCARHLSVCLCVCVCFFSLHFGWFLFCFDRLIFADKLSIIHKHSSVLFAVIENVQVEQINKVIYLSRITKWYENKNKYKEMFSIRHDGRVEHLKKAEFLISELGLIVKIL